MPAPIPIIAPTIVRFTMKHLLSDSRPADNIIDVSLDEIASTRHDAVVDLVNGVRDAWQSNIMPLPTDNLSFTGGHYIDLDSLGGVSGDFSFNPGLPHVGPSSEASMTPQCSALINKLCGHSRRQRPGRLFLAGMAESFANDDGTVPSSNITVTNTHFEAFRSALTHASGVTHPGTTAWRVIHVEGHDGVPVPGHPNGRPNAWSSSDVSAAVCDSRVATQRRRLR